MKGSFNDFTDAAMYKRSVIKAAKELFYDDDVIRQLEETDDFDVASINKIMATARKKEE